ncbi:MAG: hypothetical protein IJ468_04795 [Lachnospiraceae bacterium]|nr:hypothetical protein [Lachnospiraceae bacterium]
MTGSKRTDSAASADLYITIIRPKGDEVSDEELAQCEYIGVIRESYPASDSLKDMQMNFDANECRIYRKSETESIAKWEPVEPDSRFYNDDWSGKTYRFKREISE